MGGTATARNRSAEIQFSYVPRDMDPNPIGNLVEGVLERLGFTGVWTIAFKDKIRWKGQHRFEVMGQRAGSRAITLKARGNGSDTCWKLEIVPPHGVDVADAESTLRTYSGWDGKQIVGGWRNSEQDDQPAIAIHKPPADKVAPPPLVVSPQPVPPEQPVALASAGPAVTDLQFASKIRSIAERAAKHRELEAAVTKAQAAVDEAYAAVAAAERELEMAQIAAAGDSDGKSACEMLDLMRKSFGV